MESNTTIRARELRERQTAAEALLWGILRAKQLCGLKFRRQHPIPPFVADFACVTQQVIVELDGGYHDYQYEDDAKRQTRIEQQGWMVIRFSNEEVVADFEAVAIAIAKQLGLEPEFHARKRVLSGMLSARRPSPGPAARPLPEGEVTVYSDITHGPRTAGS